MIQIANPIYDEAFKFLMADNKSATILLSALLGDDIQLISLLPQERSIHTSAVIPQLSVIRFDYIALVEIHGQQKKVLIELQKSKSHMDIGRFRRYLGNNYTQEETLQTTPEALPIIAIYLFGFNMESAFADETTRKMLVEEEAFDRTLITNLDLAKAEGKAEAQLQIARNMLALVADDAMIATATGLSVDQVATLRQNMP